MPMDASEQEIIADVISSVRTLAAHVMTLHLQLGLCGRFWPERARLATRRYKLRSQS
jgi:hypothetical protein